MEETGQAKADWNCEGIELPYGSLNSSGIGGATLKYS